MIPSLPALSLTGPLPGAEPAAAQANGTAQDANFGALLDLCGAAPMPSGPCAAPPAGQQDAMAQAAVGLPQTASELPTGGKILPVGLAPTAVPQVPRDLEEISIEPGQPSVLLTVLSKMTAPDPEPEDAPAQVSADQGPASEQPSILADVPALAMPAMPAADRRPDQPAGNPSDQPPALPVPRAAPALAAASRPATGEAAAPPRDSPAEPAAAARLIVPQIGAEIPRQPGHSEARLRVALSTTRIAKVASEPAAAPVAITPGAEAFQPPALPAPALAPAAAQPVLAAAPQLAEGGPRPHDFTALVDRLVAARDTLQPQSATLAVQHADFGQISLRLRHDGDALSVALASADPDFARAVAAAPAPLVAVTTFDQGGQAGPRQDAQGTANSPSNGAYSQSRGSSPERRDDPPQRQSGAEPRQPAQHRAKGGQRGAIFA